MGRTKPKSRVLLKAVQAKKSTPSSEELLGLTAVAVSQGDYVRANSLALKAVQSATEKGEEKVVIDGLEILGAIQLELGEHDKARENLQLSIKLASELPNPSPAPHLYLAQISPANEAVTHFNNALVILKNKIATFDATRQNNPNSIDEAFIEEEKEVRRSASKALVGLTELYLTDLCFEENAEQICERNLQSAVEINPSDPDVYQTLASVRLSQSRAEEAQQVATQGWALWRELDPTSEEYPEPATRLSLAKLFLEMNRLLDALEILNQLEMEDDQDLEVWYLSGWAWWLRGQDETPEEGETRAECLSEAKLCFANYFNIAERDMENVDPEQMEHVKDLYAKLEVAGVVASSGQRDDEWEDEQEDEDVEMS